MTKKTTLNQINSAEISFEIPTICGLFRFILTRTSKWAAKQKYCYCHRYCISIISNKISKDLQGKNKVKHSWPSVYSLYRKFWIIVSNFNLPGVWKRTKKKKRKFGGRLENHLHRGRQCCWDPEKKRGISSLRDITNPILNWFQPWKVQLQSKGKLNCLTVNFMSLETFRRK